MDLQKAIEILEYHQEWRQGKRDEMIHEPKVLTQALDVVLELVKQKFPSEKCDEACFYHCTKNGSQKPECKK